MRSKAISAMIATVLLIAFTVAVGGILSMWLSGLATTQTETTGAAANAQVLCGRTALKVKEVTFTHNSSQAAFSNVTVSYEYGTENLYNFSITFIDSNRNSYTVPATSLATHTGVTQYNSTSGQSFTPGMIATWGLSVSDYSGSLTSLIGSSLTTVKVVALCQNTYPVSVECDSGQSCMV